MRLDEPPEGVMYVCDLAQGHSNIKYQRMVGKREELAQEENRTDMVSWQLSVKTHFKKKKMINCKRRAESWELGGHRSPLGALFQGNGEDETAGI